MLKASVVAAHAAYTVLHLSPAVQLHSIYGRLKHWSIQALQHLCNDCIDVCIVQPADGQGMVSKEGTVCTREMLDGDLRLRSLERL